MKPRRRISPWAAAGLGVYSAIWWAAHHGAKVLRPFSAAMRLQSKGRSFSKVDWTTMQQLGAGDKPVAIFFCSSAGEYEQACPVMDLLADTYQPVVFFFSANGMRHFEKVGGSVPAWMSPPDVSWIWRRIYAALRPEHTLVVRHGFWPAMVLTAHRYSALTAIDVVLRERSGSWTVASKRRLFRWFDAVHLATERDLALLQDDHARYAVSGNTKYDRAAARHQAGQARVESYRKRLGQLTSAPRVLVVGSAYREDVEVVLKALALMSEAVRSAWHVLLVPHDVSAKAIQSLEVLLTQHAVLHQRWGAPKATPQATITVVAQVGMLFELYGTGSAALVGGGFSGGTHNVVEPAVYGLPLASGPVVDTDREAYDLTERGLLRTVATAQELATWLTEVHTNPERASNALAAYLSAVTGASQRIVNALPDRS